jgi:hypothetical protein
MCHSWWWRQYAPLKRRSTINLHGSTTQKTALNIIILIYFTSPLFLHLSLDISPSTSSRTETTKHVQQPCRQKPVCCFVIHLCRIRCREDERQYSGHAVQRNVSPACYVDRSTHTCDPATTRSPHIIDQHVIYSFILQFFLVLEVSFFFGRVRSQDRRVYQIHSTTH